MKVSNLVFTPKLDGSLEIEFKDYGHSRNVVSESSTFISHLTTMTGEAEHDRFYKKTDVIMPYNQNYVGEPDIYFNAPVINHLFFLKLYSGFGRQTPWVCTQYRAPEDPRSLEDRFQPIEFIRAFQKIGVDITKYVSHVFGSASYYGGNDNVDQFGRHPITVHDFMNRVLGQGLEYAGHYYDLSFLTAQEEVDMERFNANPTQYIVSEYNMKYEAVNIKPDPNAKVISVESVITPEVLGAIEAMATSSIADIANSAKMILRKYSYLGTNDKNLVLALYKLTAGFDDYDSQRGLERAIMDLSLGRTFETKLVATILTLLCITNYSGSNSSCYYGSRVNSDVSMRECMEDHGITLEDLYIPTLEYTRIGTWKENIRRADCDKLFSLQYITE